MNKDLATIIKGGRWSTSTNMSVRRCYRPCRRIFGLLISQLLVKRIGGISSGAHLACNLKLALSISSKSCGSTHTYDIFSVPYFKNIPPAIVYMHDSLTLSSRSRTGFTMIFLRHSSRLFEEGKGGGGLSTIDPTRTTACIKQTCRTLLPKNQAFDN